MGTAFLKKKNNAVSSINMGGGLAQSAVSLTVASGAVFPTTGDFMVTLWDKSAYASPSEDPGMEIVKCTARSGDVLTITRGQESTADVAHSDAEAVELLLTVGQMEEYESAIGKLEAPPINTQTDDYTLVLTDDGKFIDMDKGTAVVLTVPKNSVVAFPIGTTIAFRQKGAGQVTLTPIDGDVTIDSQDGLVTTGQHAVVSIIKVATDIWVAVGSLESA